MAEVTVEQLAQNIANEMETRMGIGGRGLAAKLHRGGRLMPRSVRADAKRIAEALPLVRHPKLIRQVDVARLEAAERRVLAWLKTVDPRERRLDMVLGMAGGVALSILTTGALVIAVLIWRGYV